MNVTNDFDITNYILYDVPRDNRREYTQFLRASLEEASTITSQVGKEYLCKHVNMTRLWQR